MDGDRLMFIEVQVRLMVPVYRECGETYHGGEMRVREMMEGWSVYRLHGKGYKLNTLDRGGKGV